MKLALGTAQFGMNYGASNTRGIVPPEEVKKILLLGESNGIDILDTSRDYGIAEEVIGKLTSSYKVVTKTETFDSPDELRRSVERSLKAMNSTNVHGLLIHDTDDFFKDPHSNTEVLEALKQEKIATKVGASIYDPEEAHRLLKWFQPDIIQLPLNILDQRALSLLETLRSQRIEVHVRSVFLQGTLLMDPSQLPSALGDGIGKIKKFQYDCKVQGINPLVGALQFIKQQAGVDRIVVGCCSAEELRQVIRAFNSAPTSLVYGSYSSTQGYNPSQW